MNQSVNIGLLWDEPELRGELICTFAVQCWTDCNRWLDLDSVAGKFTARRIESPVIDSESRSEFAVRLAESLSPEHANRTLEIAAQFSGDLNLDVVEAGRIWTIGNRTYDNRVWWPVAKVNSRSDAETLLRELRRAEGLNPMGFTVVRLAGSPTLVPFEFSLGTFSARVVRVSARPSNPESFFWLYDVPVGRGFHWEHLETFEYRGELQIFPQAKGLTASNRIQLESYLESAVGSEMRHDLPEAFSQAQAIAARSTVLATANRHHYADGFDLCNDDHCQCYHGVKRESKSVTGPIRSTSGIILQFPAEGAGEKREGMTFRAVDARYAKSCGGISECYEAAWGAQGPKYFAVRACGDYVVPDLTDENAVLDFLRNPPPAFCNPGVHPYPDPWDKDKLFRWRFTHTGKQLGELIAGKTGMDVGEVRALRTLRRGASGRILILEVTGSKGIQTIYGELAVRRALSASHLPSSCFVVEQERDQYTLHGGGWGHGVGLCQLGACAMARQGWNAERILNHYYPGSSLSRA